MFREQSGAPAVVAARLVWTRLRQHLHRIARRGDRQQAEAQQAAQPVHAAIPVAAAPRGRHRQPHLVGHARAVGDLQQQLQAQAELHFDDRQGQRFASADRNDIAALHFPFHVEASGLQEAFDSRVE